jgi:cytochrome c553
MFIARRGSWNRSKPNGFDGVGVRASADGKSAKMTPFLTGFNESKDSCKFWGRPVYIAQVPDGALLVSDEQVGAIYRISYQKGRGRRNQEEVMRRCHMGRWAAGLLAAIFVVEGAAQETCLACHSPGGNSRSPGVPSIAGQPKLFIENQLVLIREELRTSPQMLPVVQGMKDAEISRLAQ